MHSVALTLWQAYRCWQLDKFEEIHRAIGSNVQAVKAAREQINQAYVLMLSSQFQGFCRELHSECVDHLVAAISSPIMRSIVRQNFVAARMLDRVNVRPESINEDFNRLGLIFWNEVDTLDAKAKDRRKRLVELNECRNAIAHHDFKPGSVASNVTLAMVRQWRSACNGLASDFDQVMHHHLTSLLGRSPW